MLIKSMTGYGRAVETVNGREFTVEIRSVNKGIWIVLLSCPEPCPLPRRM